MAFGVQWLDRAESRYQQQQIQLIIIITVCWITAIIELRRRWEELTDADQHGEQNLQLTLYSTARFSPSLNLKDAVIVFIHYRWRIFLKRRQERIQTENSAAVKRRARAFFSKPNCGCFTTLISQKSLHVVIKWCSDVFVRYLKLASPRFPRQESRYIKMSLKIIWFYVIYMICSSR